MLKTGLIQPETIPGHFPRNLRTIVELYRSCLDAGAELVLCPPLALSGVHTGELALPPAAGSDGCGRHKIPPVEERPFLSPAGRYPSLTAWKRTRSRLWHPENGG